MNLCYYIQPVNISKLTLSPSLMDSNLMVQCSLFKSEASRKCTSPHILWSGLQRGQLSNLHAATAVSTPAILLLHCYHFFYFIESTFAYGKLN